MAESVSAEQLIDFEPVIGFAGSILDSHRQAEVKLVCLAVSAYVNGFGELFMPTIPELSKDTGLTEETVIESLLEVSNTGDIPTSLDHFNV